MLKSNRIFNKFTYTALILFCLFKALYAVDSPTNWYSAGKWSYPLPYLDFEGDDFNLHEGYYAYILVDPSEPFFGYPYHMGYVKGVNDTVRAVIIITNKTSGSIDIQYESPEDWFVPQIYRNYSSFEHDHPSADTSDFSYSFKYFVHPGGFTKPDSIKANKALSIEYYLWDLPLGANIIHFAKTSAAPDSLDLHKTGNGQYVYTQGAADQDKINAYAQICKKMEYHQNYTSALAWTDSMLAVNDSSIVGWTWRARIYGDMRDSTNTIDCYSRIISIIDNNNDSLIDLDDTPIDNIIEWWKIDRRSHAVFYKYIFETGEIIYLD